MSIFEERNDSQTGFTNLTSTELCFLEKVKLIGFFSFPICYPSSGTVRGVSISSHEVSSHFLSSNGFAH